MFKVPESSSPPSTPTSRTAQIDSLLASRSEPTTTPAGPPPRTSLTQASTTPAGVPPSSVFGSNDFFSSPDRHAHNAFNSSPLRRAEIGAEPGEVYLRGSHIGNDDTMDVDEDRVYPLSGLSELRSGSVANLSRLSRAFTTTPKQIHDSDDTIISTEKILHNLHAQIRTNKTVGFRQEDPLANAGRDLINVWEHGLDLNKHQEGIGPGKGSPPLAKAAFIASLAISLHTRSSQVVQLSSTRNPTFLGHPKPIPEVLLDWLRMHHQPFADELSTVFETQPNPTSNNRFWDVIFSSLVRGYLREVSGLLKEADFQFALTAYDDGADQPGYRGKQLGNVKRVVNRAIQILDLCPAMQKGDWNVRGPDWVVFRKRVHQAITDLETFAEGPTSSYDPSSTSDFQATNFGLSSIRSDDLSISALSRRAESKVPWSIYQNLLYFYGHLLGTHSEIVSSASDWLEATLGIAAWWDGNEESGAQENLSTSRRFLADPRSLKLGSDDPFSAYQKKLATTLQQVTFESDELALRVDTADPVQVGLTCVLENNIEGLVTVLQNFSSTVSAAVAEIAQAGSWSGIPSAVGSAANLNESDLLVLSYGQRTRDGIGHEEILTNYADLVARKQTLQSSTTKETMEGWQLALQVLGRMSNASAAQLRIAKILSTLNLYSSERVEQVSRLCSKLGLFDQVQKVSERYADHLIDTTQEYGQAILYFAKSRNLDKAKAVINLLSTCCLIESTAFPPVSELDSTLSAFLSSPKHSLALLTNVDGPVASAISSYISGYAMLRKYYNLRNKIQWRSNNKSTLKPRASEKEAAAALVAVISSAADSIHGGLFDPNVDNVIPLEGLLILLGESLMFVDHTTQVLNAQQVFAIMKAAEDVSTVSEEVYSTCEEMLRAAIASAHDSDSLLYHAPAKAMALSTTLSDQLSNVGRSLLKSQPRDDGSAIIVRGNVKRSRDWRQGFRGGVTGFDVLQMLRLGLAREMSRAWTD